MSASNGKLLASASTGRLLCKASGGALLYSVAVPVDHGYSSYAVFPGAYLQARQQRDDYDYWIEHWQEVLDDLDAANRSSFLSDVYDNNAVRSTLIEYNEYNSSGDRVFLVNYLACCIRFRPGSGVVAPSPAAVSHVVLDLACGRTFSGATTDTFDDNAYVAGAITASASSFQTPADVIQNAQFRINVGDCQRVTSSLGSPGYCTPSSSGHTTSNSYGPIQSVSIDGVIPFLSAFDNLSELYLWLVIDSPCHIPSEHNPYIYYGIVASPERLHLFA